MSDPNRREFLRTAGGLTLGLIGTGLAGGALACATSKPGETTTITTTVTTTPLITTTMPPPPETSTDASVVPAALTVPWAYQKLDASTAAARAYSNYANGGCMYATFEAIIGALGDQLGEPYKSFPFAMMKYGTVGVAGWGSLCGALNGAAAAIYLLASRNASALVSELFYWHGATALPDYTPAESKFDSIPASVADSPLCHESITKWCVSSGFKTTSAERNERCTRLTASVTRKTVELLNQQADGLFKAAFTMPESVAACLACHGPYKSEGDVHVSGHNACATCHDDLGSPHPDTTQ